MSKALHRALWVCLCINLWLFAGYFVIHSNAGADQLLSAQALVTIALLILAPALTFMPVATWLNAPFYDVEATLGWSVFGIVITFTSPASDVTRGQFLLFTMPLTVAVASLTTLVTYMFVRRIRGGKSTSADFVQARREGYLAAITVVGLLLLYSFGVLTPFNSLLAITSMMLAEALLLVRRQPFSERSAS